ncbi:MAG: class I SAM-dependent methyltransferase [Candidatus Lokiarchaeota archaeon]
MSGKDFHHPWNGEHAQKFARSVENMKKSRYIPFAKEIYNFVNIYVKKEYPIIVDVGCGPGFLLFEIAKLMPDFELIGVDFSEDMLRIAREKAAEKDLNLITFKHGPAENIPLPYNYYDIPLIFKSGLQRTVTYYNSRELWLDPEQVIVMMKDIGFKIEYLNKKLDYLLVARK